MSAGVDPVSGERISLTDSVVIEKPGNSGSERAAVKEAERRRTKLLADADELRVARTRTTVGALVERWMSQHEIDSTTRMTYEAQVRLYILPNLGDVPLTHFARDARGVALIGRGLSISPATSYRYLHEAIDVLAEQAPDLHHTLARGREQGWSHVILDGKVVGTDRVAATTISTKGATIDAWYSGKTRDFGANIQALARPTASRCGSPRWSPAASTT